jgi:hypothetical protein
MSNIKDVCTVAIDSAVMLFPVDRERYELAVAIRLMTEGNRPLLIDWYEHIDGRVTDWFKTTDENLSLAANAFAVAVCADRSTLSTAGLFRCMAVEAVRLELPEFSSSVPCSVVQQIVYLALWQELGRRVNQSQHFNCGSSSTGRNSI